MVRDNIIEEIQKLVQKIETNFQEGADYQKPYWSLKGGPGQSGAIHHLSPRLKSFLRKKFDFPPTLNDYLDYSKTDLAGNNYYYRLDGEHGKGEFEGLYFRHSNKGLEQEQPKKCKQCGEMTFEENGRMWLWNKKTVGKDFGQESKVIGYFHPHCAKRHFADKNQPNQNDNSRLKEKLLRNLDKLCLDPEGYLANNEYLKTDGADKEYHQQFNSNTNNWIDRYLKITIEGEEINLEKWDNYCEEYYEVKRELIKKIKQEIKQNPSEWKIEQVEVLPGLKYDRQNWLVKHQSGLRYWKLGISNMWGKQEWRMEGKNYWAEIEALINGSEIPINDNLNNFELENLKKIFKVHKIRKITFKNGELFIKYDNEVNPSEKVNNQEFQELVKYCREHNEREIDCERLGIKIVYNNNHQLAIGLALGAGAIIFLVGIIYLFVSQKKKSNK